MNQNQELYAEIIERIEKMERNEIKPDSVECQKLFFMLQTLVSSNTHDVAGLVAQKLEDNGHDPSTVARWHFFIETFSGHVTLGNRRYTLLIIPVMAASAYGLPFGAIPEDVLKVIDHNLRVLMPNTVDLCINPYFLTPEAFDYSGFELNQKISEWALGMQNGRTCFIESNETHEEANELVADIRLIAAIIAEPVTKPLLHLNNYKRLSKELLKALQKHFIATRFEFPFALSEQMLQYLKEIKPQEFYMQDLFLTPIAALTEAGKAFRHVALREALMNLKQTYELTSEKLQATVGAFYENVQMGVMGLAEFRVGFGLPDKPEQIVQGIAWPVFNEPAEIAFDTLTKSLRYHGFIEGQNATVLQGESFFMDEEDEEVLYPNATGTLCEPSEPEIESAMDTGRTPSNFILN